MTEELYGKREEEGKGRSKTKRAVILLGILLVAMAAGTQYAASQFNYQEILGFNINGVYPPFMLAVWYLQWGGGAEYAKVFETGLLIAGVICSAGFLGFLIILNIMRNTAAPVGNLHGSARWADLDDIVNATLLPHPKARGRDGRPAKHEGVYVGGWVHPKTKELVYLRHNGPEHVLCYAPTRSGKGVGLVNPTLLSWKESCIITDIKGELWELTSGWRKRHAKNKVIRFEPASLNSAHWNVFDSIRFGTEYEERDVGNVAALIVDPDGKGFEDHWAKTAHALMIGCILHVHYKAIQTPGAERSLSAVDSLLSNPDKPIAETWKEMKEFKHLPPVLDDEGGEVAPARTHETVAKAAQDMLDRAEAEGASVLSTTKSYLSLYRDPVIRKNTGDSDFTIHQIANSKEPVSLYIITKPADLTRIRPIFRLMITMAVSILADELKPVSGRMERMNIHRTLLMLDEFPSLGKLDIMQRALAFIAGYGLKAYLITQDLSQLYAAYGKEEAITSNCHIQIAYPPNRPETAKYISGLTGGTTVIKEEINVSGKRTGLFQNNVSITKREQARNLLTEDEVLRLPSPLKDHNANITKPGHMLIFCAGLPAIYGRQILYFQDKAFLARSRIAAPKESDSLREYMTAVHLRGEPPEMTRTVYAVGEAEEPAADRKEGEAITPTEPAAHIEPEDVSDSSWAAKPEEQDNEPGETSWGLESEEQDREAAKADAKRENALDGLEFV